MHQTKETPRVREYGPAVSLEVKALADEDGTFEGYASVFGNVDGGNDVMSPGCFSASLAKRGTGKVKMLWQHDTRHIIGKWLEMREDSKGLWCKGKLFMGVQAGKECYELMKEGAIDSLSIGYRTKREEWDRDAEVRRLHEVDLLEVSAVTFPMNEMATISLVKSDGTLPTEREIESYLRDAGLSRNQAKALVAGGHKAMCNLRDAGSEDVDKAALEAIHRLAAAMRG